MAQSEPGGRPATVERSETEEALEPPYRLVLLDDDQHSYDYVIQMLGAIFGYGREKAFALARLVDTQGHVTVATDSRERVTEYQRRIHGYGPDPRIETCKGSMSATIEPAE